MPEVALANYHVVKARLMVRKK